MSGQKPAGIDDVRAPSVGPKQRHLLALEVCRRHETDPSTALDLLKMLGLVTDTREKTW